MNKATDIAAFLKLFSFNRYMVECESFSKSVTSSQLSSFNRYMVECECFQLFN
ncbi:hypothetical protein CLOL250_00474 [Clostridium sp. L2-50]|nr:hypothetical protein CLOL250_00474 [Clostridium sp. L2-50]